MTLRACIGLGANLGDAAVALQNAAAAIAAWPSVQGLRTSHLYRSAPIDSSGPDYWNAALSFDTDQAPEALLAALQAIEQTQGRERPFRNAPRTLDLDLLALGDWQCAGERLTLPHPRLHQRAFVLLPLLEIEPQLALPGLGHLARYLDAVADQRIERSGLQLDSSK